MKKLLSFIALIAMSSACFASTSSVTIYTNAITSTPDGVASLTYVTCSLGAGYPPVCKQSTPKTITVPANGVTSVELAGADELYVTQVAVNNNLVFGPYEGTADSNNDCVSNGVQTLTLSPNPAGKLTCFPGFG